MYQSFANTVLFLSNLRKIGIIIDSKGAHIEIQHLVLEISCMCRGGQPAPVVFGDKRHKTDSKAAHMRNAHICNNEIPRVVRPVERGCPFWGWFYIYVLLETREICYNIAEYHVKKVSNMSFIQYLINGISLGSVYAIIALGYTMVYGIAKMLNFAHGDVIMIGAYTVLTLLTGAGMNPLLAVVIGMLTCTVLGIVIEKVAYKPLRNASSSLAVLITAIGVSYLLQNTALLVFGADTKSFINIISVPAVSVAELTITGTTIVTIIACIVIMIGLVLFVNKTKPGRAMKAVSEDRGAAQLMGVNVNATISLTFAIGSGLAAVAGVLLCSAYPSLTPYTGAMPGIKAFVAAVFGGIGSIPGAMIGGVLLGIIEILGKAYISSQVADAIVFAVLIVVLLVKPTGLFGKNIQEKV